MSELRIQIRKVGMEGAIEVKSDVVRIPQLPQYKAQVIDRQGAGDVSWIAFITGVLLVS